jgi:predicted TIM-barrel fold metal-dependent hydrolase
MSVWDRAFRGSYFRSIADATARVDALRESAIDPFLPIVDSHHHLIDGKHGRYLLPDYSQDIASGHNIRQSVFVEASTNYRTSGPPELLPVGEVEFAARIASLGERELKPRICDGIVGFADLSSADEVDAVLDAELEAGGGHLKGIRDMVHWEGSEIGSFSTRRAPPQKLLSDAFQRGVGHLKSHDLSLDVWVFHSQLADLIELADAFPDTSMILDNAGTALGVGPYADRRAEVFAQWRKSLAELAKRDNVSIKIGGFGMPYTGFDFHLSDSAPGSEVLAAAWRDYVEACIDAFGVHRAMFESNFPADKQTCSYGVLWNAFKRITADYSGAEKSALYSGTARRVYRLEEI